MEPSLLTLLIRASILWRLRTKMKPPEPLVLQFGEFGSFLHAGIKIRFCGHMFTKTHTFPLFRLPVFNPESQRPHEGQSWCWEGFQSWKTKTLRPDRRAWRQTTTDHHGMSTKYAWTHIKCMNLLPVGTRFFQSRLSLLLWPYSCLTRLTTSFVISNHLLFERLWQTGVLTASVWCWEPSFPAE